MRSSGAGPDEQRDPPLAANDAQPPAERRVSPAPLTPHPLDIDLYDFAVHLRHCLECRRGFAHILYSNEGANDVNEPKRWANPSPVAASLAVTAPGEKIGLSNLPGPWDWERRDEKWWRVHRHLNIEDGPHDKPRCHVCTCRIYIDPAGGSSAWVHGSKRLNEDHDATP